MKKKKKILINLLDEKKNYKVLQVAKLKKMEEKFLQCKTGKIE